MYHNWVGSMLVSGGYDMQVNMWSMSNYQLKNSYKVSIKTVIIIRFYIIYNNYYNCNRDTKHGSKMSNLERIRSGQSAVTRFVHVCAPIIPGNYTCR